MQKRAGAGEIARQSERCGSHVLNENHDAWLCAGFYAAAIMKTAAGIQKSAGASRAENRRFVFPSNCTENFFILQFVVIAAPRITDLIAQFFRRPGSEHCQRAAGFFDIGGEDKKFDLFGIGPITMIKLAVGKLFFAMKRK